MNAFSAAPVEARGLGKRYGQVVAVDKVDLTVAQGEILGLMASRPKELSYEGPEFGGGHRDSP